MIKTIFWKNNTVILIDQNALPVAERYVTAELSGNYFRYQRFNRARRSGHRCRRRDGRGFGSFAPSVIIAGKIPAKIYCYLR